MADTTVMTKPDTIVLIHGFWVTQRGAGSTGSLATSVAATES